MSRIELFLILLLSSIVFFPTITYKILQLETPYSKQVELRILFACSAVFKSSLAAFQYVPNTTLFTVFIFSVAILKFYVDLAPESCARFCPVWTKSEFKVKKDRKWSQLLTVKAHSNIFIN